MLGVTRRHGRLGEASGPRLARRTGLTCAACTRWGRVGPGRAGDVDDAVDDLDGPVAGVQVDVVPATDQHQIPDRGHAAVEPRCQVVGVAVDGWGAADHAALVAGVQGAPDRAGDESFGAADVEGFGV